MCHHNVPITFIFLPNIAVESTYLVGYTSVGRCISATPTTVLRRNRVFETWQERLRCGLPERWHEGKVKERVRR